MLQFANEDEFAQRTCQALTTHCAVLDSMRCNRSDQENQCQILQIDSKGVGVVGL